MPKYRKKPVEIEAFIPGVHECPQWIQEAFRSGSVRWKNNFELIISTLEGEMVANKGDYIIRGVQGEIYPCKADIFEMTYEVIGSK